MGSGTVPPAAGAADDGDDVVVNSMLIGVNGIPVSRHPVEGYDIVGSRLHRVARGDKDEPSGGERVTNTRS